MASMQEHKCRAEKNNYLTLHVSLLKMTQFLTGRIVFVYTGYNQSQLGSVKILLANGVTPPFMVQKHQMDTIWRREC